MQVMAFNTPSRPEWRWRIVDYSGQMVEESSQTFPTIANAVTDGTRRVNELTERDLPDRFRSFTPPYRSR
jgi:hypothetical protein